jgi:hypothetical protein
MNSPDVIDHVFLKPGDKFRLIDSNEPEVVYVLGIDGHCRRVVPDPAQPDFLWKFGDGTKPFKVRRLS